MEKGGLAFCEQDCSYQHVSGTKVQGFFLHIVILISVSINFLADNLNKFVSPFFILGVNSSYHFVKPCTC